MSDYFEKLHTLSKEVASLVEQKTGIKCAAPKSTFLAVVVGDRTFTRSPYALLTDYTPSDFAKEICEQL